MKLNKAKPYFMFTKEQRSGILFLFLIIVLLQFVYYFVEFNNKKILSPNQDEWLSFQKDIDSLKENQPTTKYKIYPFNPNFITDFKGYKLGMTVEQIDRLLAFRKLGKFANSPKEFQLVTGVSDSLLNAISPYFKFPDWVNNKSSNYKSNWINYSKENKNYSKTEKEIIYIDINVATKEEIMAVYGIGDAISDRILKQKETLGAFVSMEQMNDVWGLQPEVIEKINQKFKIINPPAINKIKINEATIKELGNFPYFRYPISKNIVVYRTMNGDIKIEDLAKIKDFPVEKIKIIALYLEF